MKINDLNPIFVDLDGVMADFDKRLTELVGKVPEGEQWFWQKIADIVIKPGSDRSTVLKLASKKDLSTVDDLGFPKGHGSKIVTQMLKQKFLDRVDTPNVGPQYSLTDLGRHALSFVVKGDEFRSGPDFYNSLDKMPDADQLWSVVSSMNPVILTGKPMGNWAETQKRAWVSRELGPDVPVIVCWAKQKAQKASEYMGTPGELNGAILIDDREKARAPWEAFGGRFILHTSASNSIAQLNALD